MKKYPQSVYGRTLRLFYVFFAVLWSVNVWGHSIQESYEKAESSQEKIYVTPEQIEVTEDGVLFYDGLREFPILGKNTFI